MYVRISCIDESLIVTLQLCVCVCCLLCHSVLCPLVYHQGSIEQSKTQYLEVLKENTRRLNKVSELQHSKKEFEKRLNARQKAMVGSACPHAQYLTEYTCTQHP